MTESTAPTATKVPPMTRKARRGMDTPAGAAPLRDERVGTGAGASISLSHMSIADAGRNGRSDRDRGREQVRERVLEDEHQAHDAQDNERAVSDATIAPGSQADQRAEQRAPDEDHDLERELVVGAEQRHHEVLGAGRLKGDHERADCRDRRRRTEHAGDDLANAYRHGRGRYAGDCPGQLRPHRHRLRTDGTFRSEDDETQPVVVSASLGCRSFG